MFWFNEKNKYFSTYTNSGIQTFISNEITYVLGYKSDELIGMSVYDFFDTDDLSRISKAHLEIASNNAITTAVYRMRHKDGHYVWVRSYSQNTGNELISITKKLNKIEIFLFKMSQLLEDNYK